MTACSLRLASPMSSHKEEPPTRAPRALQPWSQQRPPAPRASPCLVCHLRRIRVDAFAERSGVPCIRWQPLCPRLCWSRRSWMQAFQEHLWSQRLWRQQADNPAASRDPTTFPRASRRRGPSSNHGVGRARRYGSPVRSCSMGMTPSYEVIAHYKALAPPRLAVYQTHKPWSRACDAGPVRKETTAGQHPPRVSNAPPGPLVSLARATPSCRATAGCCWGGPRIARSALRGWRRRRHARASHTPGPGGPSSSQAASRGRGFRAPPTRRALRARHT